MQARRPGLTGPTAGRARSEDQTRASEASAEREADAEQGVTGTTAAPHVDQSGTGITPGADAEPRVGESGRWFRPAKAEAGFLAIPADNQADVPLAGAEPKVTAADASADGGGVTTPRRAAPGTAPSTAETDAAPPSAAADAEGARRPLRAART